MSIIERLYRVLPRLEDLPREVQEEAATYLEALTESLEAMEASEPGASAEQEWVSLAGALNDIPDDFLEELDRMRHETEPTPPVTL